MVIRFLFVLCCFLFIHKEEAVISWSEAYKLSWSDFKAKPDMHVNAVAITASGITFGFSIKQTDNQIVSFSTEVHAHFYPEQSWYKPELADNHVLGHEQLHYDITELYARKFRQKIEQLKVSNTIKRDLNKLHENINKELAGLQNEYDNASDYSRNKAFQAKWKSYIEMELQKLSKYKSKD